MLQQDVDRVEGRQRSSSFRCRLRPLASPSDELRALCKPTCLVVRSALGDGTNPGAARPLRDGQTDEGMDGHLTCTMDMRMDGQERQMDEQMNGYGNRHAPTGSLLTAHRWRDWRSCTNHVSPLPRVWICKSLSVRVPHEPMFATYVKRRRVRRVQGARARGGRADKIRICAWLLAPCLDAVLLQAVRLANHFLSSRRPQRSCTEACPP